MKTQTEGVRRPNLGKLSKEDREVLREIGRKAGFVRTSQSHGASRVVARTSELEVGRPRLGNRLRTLERRGLIRRFIQHGVPQLVEVTSAGLVALADLADGVRR